jgi:hypothetical protein
MKEFSSERSEWNDSLHRAFRLMLQNFLYIMWSWKWLWPIINRLQIIKFSSMYCVCERVEFGLCELWRVGKWCN